MPYNRRTGEYYESRSRGGYNRNRRNNESVRKSGSYTKNGGKSGCKLTQDAKGRPCIVAWNKSKTHGLRTLVAVPCNDFEIPKKNKVTGKPQNSKCDKWVAKVKGGMGSNSMTAFYNPTTKKLTIPDLEMVANPNKNYFGTYNKF